MKKPSSISRRLMDCFEAESRGDHEAALIHFFPALDKTAKRRRPRSGVGERIKLFLSEQEGITSVVATGNMFRNILIDGVSFPDAIYKFGRTAVMHEGELDPRLEINNSGELSMGQVWSLPASYIPALCVGVIVAPENSMEHLERDIELHFLKTKWRVNDIWGAEQRLKDAIAAEFRRPDLFSDWIPPGG